jgi:AcrR family transcriptional regulator
VTRPAHPALVNELLHITTALIAGKGAAADTMREIAGLAGVPPITIHYYHSDKRGLFEAAKRCANAELDKAVAAALDAPAGAVAQLR